MQTRLNEAGYLCREELVDRLPSFERAAQGPVAVIECTQDIPCNPCEQSCPFGAITVGQPITSLPVLDEKKCRGCGACIAQCPGLAIFVVDCSQPGAKGTVQMPYEYDPLPQAGDVVYGVSRSGRPVVEARVEKVVVREAYDHTAVVTVSVPREAVHEVRCIRRKEA